MFSRIIGTGSALPKKIVTNDELAKTVDTSHDWIVERTGIHARHVADQSETAATLAATAANNALEMAGLSADKLDLIIVGTATPNYFFPATACEVQAMIGASCPAFDLQAACSGFIYGLSVADQFIKAGQYEHVLVIGSEIMSRLVDWQDRNTCVLFGDGAGAAVLSRSDEAGVLGTELYADGRETSLLCVENPQVKYHGSDETAQVSSIDMSGRKVFRFAVSKLESVVVDILARHQIGPEDIDWLIPHQANARIIEATREKLGMPPEKVILTLAKHGNTSSASVPLAMDAAIRDGRIKPGQLLLLEAFGAGLTWGAALVRF